ncbi:RNA-guided endonuclease InsQ/TnpB family protein [Paraburkholderia youngii]|uniref:Transposase n=1 Tax=Paraburkholderia youngii TaxID=2782701 RepID=A0A7Y6K9D4_9BURK|nr:RNA-guided endonuclease TnpB family protein [Paraburkholderia youngii]NUY05768.1 transposase [Paraburkholderia youngii]
MQRLQAFKFELMPTGEQVRKMCQFAGACRFVFNRALALQVERYKGGEKKLGYAGLCKQLTEWRNSTDTPWLADLHSQVGQQALKDLERAYTNFFDGRASFPRFRRKGERDSFRFPQRVEVDCANGRVRLPKLGWLRYRNSRAVPGEVRSATVSLHAGKWYVSILTTREVEASVPHGPAVGIDVGITRFATLSDSTFIAPLNSFRKHEQRLAKYQRRMGRKVKGSANWKKAKARIQRIHARIANVRSDFLHKASATISKNHAMIAVEDLKVRNMSKSASGTLEAPGRNVRAKSGLNKAILDQGWGEFRRQLEYKTAWCGGFFVVVHPRNTSRTCPCCGHVSAENRTSQAKFLCAACGYENHADVVGAINILSRGSAALRDEGQDTGDASPGCACTARIACGEPVQSGRSVKQEPAEVTMHTVSHA